MRLWLLLVPVLGLGCDRVFGLVGRDDKDACASLEVGPAEFDDDQDTIDNASDNCPLTANIDQHDEDSDGSGDDCDLCPIGNEDRDADCDGLGDSCDPDDTLPNVRVFHGFGTGNGVAVYGPASIVDGVLRMREVINRYPAAVIGTRIGHDGVTETTFTTGDTSTYFDVRIRFAADDAQGARTGHYAMLAGNGSSTRLELGSYQDGNNMEMAMAPVEGFASGTYTMRLIAAAPTLRVELIGGANVMANLDGTTFPLIHADNDLEIRANSLDIDFTHVTWIGPAP